MSQTASLVREARFMMRDKALVAWLAITLTLSSVAVWLGTVEISHQHSRIEALLQKDREDRNLVLSQQADWGDVAYSTFHLTFDRPTPFAFAAIGARDTTAWLHRVRMLALEGQIYEADVVNPEFALIGRLDFSFIAAFILPLILIVTLHDTRAREREAGRYELLETIAGGKHRLWAMRVGLKAGAICLCMIAPLLAGAVISGTAWDVAAVGALIVTAHGVFWATLCYVLSSWKSNSAVILTTLVGAWFVLAVIAPIGGRMAIDKVVVVPSGAEIIMTQREAVNDAWDLPKDTTMQSFLRLHPEWTAHATIESPFEWKWYYAFQMVGDQSAKPLSDAYRTGRLKRDELASTIAAFAPPALVERAFQRLAGTDMKAAIAYEDAVRDFHRELRTFYYPKLFLDEPFSAEQLSNLPSFKPRGRDAD